MKLWITDQKETCELSYWNNGIDVATNLIGGQTDGVTWDEEHICYACDAETFAWWDEYFDGMRTVDAKREELESKFEDFDYHKDILAGLPPHVDMEDEPWTILQAMEDYEQTWGKACTGKAN